MNFRVFILFYLAIILPLALKGQKGLVDFPEFIMTHVPGATTLTKPVLVVGSKGEVISEGHGLAAPAYYDWDDDGLRDLLVGEFGSGLEHGRYVGNFIRVYKNIGTEGRPEFDGTWDYARPPFQFNVQGHGTPYSVDQFCCIGFTPQFIDLNNDGYVDMTTGSYYGEVLWFRGTVNGFMAGEPLPQEGNPRDEDYVRNLSYWIYSSASFGDLTGDGLNDLVLGGRSLRFSKNIGTLDNPKFGERKLLVDVNGKPLKIYEYTPQEREKFRESESYVAGDAKLSPVVVDWDKDGVLDLLVANSYSHGALATVSFFKGIKVNKEHRFHPSIPLFSTVGDRKAFPGSSLRVFLADWNSDGVDDLLIGTSVVTLNGVFSDLLSWNWEDDMGLHGAGKDPANVAAVSEDQLALYRKHASLPPGITIDEYMTLRHRGYVYVMLGSSGDSKPVSKTKAKTK